MPTYGYVAIDRSGRMKKGSIDAASTDLVKSSLKSSGLTPIEVNEQSIMTKDIELPFTNRIKPRDLAVFCHQFNSILSAGVPVSEALIMLSSQTENKRLRAAISDTQVGIERGDTLSDSMSRHPKVFPAMLVNMVAAGEATGNLEVSLERMAVHFEKDSKVKNTVKKAMIYPCIVVVVMVLVLIVLMTFVFPKFTALFESSGSELPAVTRVVIGISDWMTSSWYILLIGAAMIAALIIIFKRTDAGKHFFGRIARKMPMFGKLTVKNNCSRFARTISTLLSSGLSMMDALEITSRNITNIYFKEALLNARNDVSNGEQLSKSLERSGIFPPMVYHLIGIGEETGEIESMLDRLADYYDEEVETTTASLMAAIEPLTIILMAVMVGFLVIAVYVPMFSVYDNML